MCKSCDAQHTWHDDTYYRHGHRCLPSSPLVPPFIFIAKVRFSACVQHRELPPRSLFSDIRQRKAQKEKGTQTTSPIFQHEGHQILALMPGRGIQPLIS